MATLSILIWLIDLIAIKQNMMYNTLVVLRRGAAIITVQELQLIEEIGMYFENTGHQRTVGRILGYLLLAGEPKTLDDIAAGLLVSKATASLTVRQGMLMGIFEKTAIPGNRRLYYRVDVRSWIENWSRLLYDPFAELERLLNKALGLIKPQRRTARENLTLMRDLIQVMERHFSDLLEQFKQQLQENSGSDKEDHLGDA